jgi:ferritin
MKYKLISEILDKEVQKRIKVEFDSASIYYAMGSWCRYNGYNNVAKFFFTHGDEEKTHAQKVIDYLDDKNCMAIIPLISKPDVTEYSNIKTLFEIAMSHEMDVTKSYNELASLALKENDHEVYEFSQGVLSEQREELATFDNYLDKLELLENGPQADYLFDHDFS